MQKRWILAPSDDGAQCDIAWSEICGLPCITELLKRKGFTSADEVNAFLQPRLSFLSDPFGLPNMAAAVNRILRALDRAERIVLFGGNQWFAANEVPTVWTSIDEVGGGSDPYVMVTFHHYDPWTFCGDNQGTYDDDWSDSNQSTPMETMNTWAATVGAGMESFIVVRRWALRGRATARRSGVDCPKYGAFLAPCQVKSFGFATFLRRSFSRFCNLTTSTFCS